MPQFDPANFAPQIAWLAIIFAVLYFGIVRLTLPKVGRVVEQREAQVGGDILAAEAAKLQADEIAAINARELKAAREAAQASLAAAKTETSKSIEVRLKAIDAELRTKLEAAEVQVAAARDAAKGEIETLAHTLSNDIVARLLGRAAPAGN